MILDHKKRFRDTPHAKIWHDATASEWFQSGLQAGLLELLKSLTAPQELGAAAANDFRRQGAQLLVSTLLNLTETTSEPRPRFEQNLGDNT